MLTLRLITSVGPVQTYIYLADILCCITTTWIASSFLFVGMESRSRCFPVRIFYRSYRNLGKQCSGMEVEHFFRIFLSYANWPFQWIRRYFIAFNLEPPLF